MLKSTRARPRVGTRPRALIIDDHLTQRDLYALVIADEFSVLTATRGETGYALACAEHPEVIVVDVRLPDVDGLKLCEDFRNNPQTTWIPLIVLTGDDTAFARASLTRSLDAVLAKPCPADHLLATMRRAIASRAVR